MKAPLLTLAGAVLLAACGGADAASTQAATPPQAQDQARQTATAPVQQGWLSVAVRGEGPDVILLPGLASGASSWSAVADDLATTHRLHLVDVAGFAGQPAGASRDGVVDGLAADVAAYIRTQGLERPVVIGHSMGGFTALHVARDYPDAVAGVISVDSLPFYPLVFDAGATVSAVRPQAEAMSASLRTMPEASYRQMQTGTARMMSKTPAAQARILEASMASERAVVAQSMLELMSTDLRPDLADITVPAGVIYAHDPMMGRAADDVDAMYRTAYSGLEGATLRRVDESFHFVMDDQPEAFVAAVRDILAEMTP